MNRYFKLDTAWDARPWIQALSAEAQNVWIKLQCYVAAHGLGGRVNALTTAHAARMFWVGEETVRQLLTAAELAGQLEISTDYWILTTWKDEQGYVQAKERMRKLRERKKEAELPEQDVTLRNVTHKKKKREEEKPPKSPEGFLLPESLESIRGSFEELVAHRKEMKKPMTPLALSKVVKTCERWGAAVAARQIAECIEHSWMVPYEPKSNGSLPGRDAKKAGSPF